MAIATWLGVVGFCIWQFARTERRILEARQRLYLSTPRALRADPSEVPNAIRGAWMLLQKIGDPTVDRVIDERRKWLLASVMAAATAWIPGSWLISVTGVDPLTRLPLILGIAFVVAVTTGSFLFRDSARRLEHDSPTQRIRLGLWLGGSGLAGVIISILVSR